MMPEYFPDIGFPRDALGRVRPSMDPFEIEAITHLLRSFVKPVRALEWGSGVSTVFFSQRLPNGSRWDSIEHVLAWHKVMTDVMAAYSRPSVQVHLVLPDGEYGEHEEGGFHNFRSYILKAARIAEKFELVLVDGRARVECVAVAWDLLTRDGVMILHDAQRPELQGVIPRGCCFVRLTARSKNRLEDIPSLLFMSHNPEPLRCIVQAAGRHLRDVLMEHNLDSALLSSRRILFINTYYSGFLQKLYQDNQELPSLPYWQQKRVVQEQCFGDSDFYSSGMIAAGWDADDLVANCPQLLAAWADDHGVDKSAWENVLLAQVREFEPDVLYFQDVSLATGNLLEMLRPHAGLVAGQIASPMPPQTDLTGIDLLFSSFPHFVEQFRIQGKAAWYQPLAFEPRILQWLHPSERKYPVTFVGGLSPHHGKGLEQLTAIAAQEPFDVWGYGAQQLPSDSPLLEHHHGEVWGLDMFNILRQSAITLNRHIDVAGDYANNMRLFEATGCGALLITDYRSNLHRLFEIGREVVAYRSAEEAAGLISYYRAYPDEAAEIAAAGQRRTLRDHTYTARMAQTAEILERQLRYQREKGRYPFPSSAVSYGYRPLAENEATDQLAMAWQHADLPARQRGLVQQELEQMYAGNIMTQFAALAELVRPYLRECSSVLELGCASGYYYEILEYLLGIRIDYTGVDYSEAMIAMARDFYSRPKFFCADAKCLFFADHQFDLVISSSVLLHVPEYRQHIEETCRVARGLVVLHRTPVYRKSPTSRMAKQAYGVETVEYRFNEQELLLHFSLHGFDLVGGIQINSAPDLDQYDNSYLLKRRSR